MNETPATGLRIGHPAPQRHNIALLPVLYALGGAPSAWMAQLLLGFAVTSYVCFTGQAHVVLATVPGWMQPLLIIANILALLASIGGLLTGLALYWRTGKEHDERNDRGVLDVGEGRTRFLSIVGAFGSTAFTVAILANTFSLFVVPLCRA